MEIKRATDMLLKGVRRRRSNWFEVHHEPAVAAPQARLARHARGCCAAQTVLRPGRGPPPPTSSLHPASGRAPPRPQNYHAAAHAGPGPSSAYNAWEAYAHAAHDAAHDWRPRSRNTALWFCLATLVGGFGIFGFALVS